MRRLHRVLRIRTKEKPVVLEHRAATRRRDDDGVEAARFDFARPRIDICLRLRGGVVLATEVMDERSTAPGARGNHNLDTETLQDAPGGFVDFGPKRWL